jgi:hypothetical protein
MTQAHDFVDGYVLVTRNGSLFQQVRGKSSYSVFESRENAEATNASTLRGTGRVYRLARGGLPSTMVAGIKVVAE